jgi:hypothetical protein
MNALILLQLLTQLIGQADAIGKLLAQAHGEGRDISTAELDALFANDDAARARLQAAIDAAKGGGS